MERGFEIYQDKQGRWWIWDKFDESNVAMRERDKESALLSAMNMLQFKCTLRKERRDKAESSLAILQTAFETVFKEEE